MPSTVLTSRARAAVIAAACIGLGLATACAPSNDGSGGDSGAADSGQSQDVSQFVTAVQAAQKGPESFAGPTDKPVTVPKDIKVAIIPCGVAIGGCNTPAEAVKGIVKTLGWKPTIYDGQSNARTQNNMILNAVSNRADVIATVSIDSKLVQQGLEAAKKAGIPVISMNNGTGSPNPKPELEPGQIDFDLDVAPDYGANGRMQADWVIADSKGTAVVQPVITSEYLSNTVTYNAFVAEMKKCAACKVLKPVNFTTDEIASGALGTRTVSTLQQHANATYVYTGFDAAAAAEVNAIRQAGLGAKVKLVSAVGDPINRQFIREGDIQGATVIEIPSLYGYATVDQMIRTVQKQPAVEPANEGAITVLLTKDNMIGNNDQWKLPFDVAAEYHKLWGTK
ncbi:sugar ABC transporter substrate-binding protein [Streptomyces sp. NPDC088197]|uniref:sugar ABC transporter substrate-binding protein n=1 Tax=unclassified Streptomyces TaxID=2593676 RepID=UPI003820AC16